MSMTKSKSLSVFLSIAIVAGSAMATNAQTNNGGKGGGSESDNNSKELRVVAAHFVPPPVKRPRHRYEADGCQRIKWHRRNGKHHKNYKIVCEQNR